MGKTAFRRQGRRPLLLCAALLCMAAFSESLAQPVGVSEGYLVGSRGGSPALAQAAGEFRIVAANLLWAKVVDHYHHQFMADGGNWAKNESLLPLLQTIITLDPHFVEAYGLMGATILPETGHVAQGQAVLAAGIHNNPNDWELDRDMAMLYAWTERKPQAALPYALAGLRQTRQITDDDGFALHLMARLCQTLERQIRDRRHAALLARRTLNARRLRQPAPARAATAPRFRPSESRSAAPYPS